MRGQQMMRKHCDIKTGKIYGCEVGTKAYYHEQGHLLYNEMDKFSSMKLMQQELIMVWMCLVSINFVLRTLYITFVHLLLLLLIWGIDMHEELWCERYARKKFKEVTNGIKQE
jgi:hypothetical protein